MKYIFLIFLFSFQQAYSQSLRLTPDLGEITSKVKSKKIIKTFGKPDSIIDNSNPPGKNWQHYQLVYNQSGVTFWITPRLIKESVKKSNLSRIEIYPNSKILFNNQIVNELDSSRVTNLYGKPKHKSFYPNEIIFSYEFATNEYHSEVRFRWERNGTLQRIEIICF